MPAERIVSTQEGQFAGFQAETPAKLANELSIQFEVDQYSEQLLQMLQEIVRVLGPVINLDALLLELYNTTELTFQNSMEQTAAAQAARETFGEVEVSDRENLALVTVWFALVHNQLEAQDREASVISSIYDFVSMLQEEIYAEIEMVETRLREQEQQLKQDQQQTIIFQQNVDASFNSAQSAGDKGIRMHQKVVDSESKERAQLKKQLAELRLWSQDVSQILLFAVSQQKILAQPVVISMS